MKKSFLFFALAVLLSFSLSGEGNTKKSKLPYQLYATQAAEQITASLSLEQKAAQMVQPACYHVTRSQMQKNCYGSILSQLTQNDFRQWQEYVDAFQNAAITSESGIPFIYGQDDVHGVNYCLNSVIFPHNIGLGAANDEALMYEIGRITAEEAKLCHMLWNFSPCVAQSQDQRWGRTYESYGSDLDIIKRLSTSYIKGMKDNGLIACSKHFLADGNVTYGTGEKSDAVRLIDRGDARLSDAKINELLSVYQAQIDAGVQTIMISHSSLNGIKMHENKKYIDILKNQMGFNGFIVSDWDSVKNTSGQTYYDQVVTSINSGIDMLMEVGTYNQAMNIIIDAVKKGHIPEARVNDAVRRIIQVKLDAGIFEDPLCTNLQTKVNTTGSDEYRAVAEKAVEESLVLIKNKNSILPLKKGTSVYIMGPAANNGRAQCGGWTIGWNESPFFDIPGVTTIKEGFEKRAAEFGINIINDENKAKEADVILLVVGEKAYAEWNGDTISIDLTGPKGLDGNSKFIKKAKAFKKPVVTLIVAGRNVFIKDYISNWDAAVMCYLPGSEGQGVANVICGKSPFKGKLPAPWYDSIDNMEKGKAWLPQGYGME